MSFDFSSKLDRNNTGSLKWSRYAGRDILPMWVADMDFRSPPAVDQALRDVIEHGVYGYTQPTQVAVDAVVNYLKRCHDWEIQPEWIVWMPGLVPALNTAARAYGEDGDAVLTCTPVYPPFLTAPVFQGKRLIKVPLHVVEGQYTFDWETLEEAVDEKTRIFFLCNPHNPVGRVFSREELLRVVDFCERHDLILISDEIHCDLILDDSKQHIVTSTLGELVQARTLTLMAPSKTYNVPGLSCSFLIIPNSKLRVTFQKACRGMITEINIFGYAGCAAALNEGESWRLELIQVLKENRNRVYEFVREHLPKIEILPMEATYLAWLDVRQLGLVDPVGHFEKHGLGLSDGVPFGFAGWLRINFGCPAEVLENGLERLKRGYEAALASH
jgi:cysteine-S-conjugate beta-lyase